MKSLEAYKTIVEWVKAQGKHLSCPHPHSCVHYVLTVCMQIIKCSIRIYSPL